MGTTPNPAPTLAEAPHNSWWVVSGTYADGAEFAGAIAFVTHDNDGRPVVDVLLGADWRADDVQYGTRVDLENITQGNPIALVDGEVPGRLQHTSALLEAALRVILSVQMACRTADRTAPAQVIIDQIEALLPPVPAANLDQHQAFTS